ncbi:phage major capsid protein [Streptomyces sp. NPDC048611]|uniref:phage major capsid protein n=1 Tax=Streptomyces sp. NPDC048611 TaxID=3155635 RepID=UPI00341785B5
MTFNASAAAKHLEAREDALYKLRKLTETWKGRSMTPTARKIESRLLAEISAADDSVRALVDSGVITEEQRRTSSFFLSNVTHAERSREQIMHFGRKLSELRELVFVDAEDSRPVDLILSAGGRGSRMLERLSSFEFEKASGYIPVKPAVTAFVQPRNVAAAADDAPMGTILVRSVKVSAVVSASNESLADVPSQDQALRDSLSAAVGQRIDHAVFNGANDGENELTGLLADGTERTYTGALTYDAVADAVAAVENASGIATGLFANPTTAATMRKTFDANKLGALPELTVLPPLADGTPVLANGVVIVLDADSVAVGVRNKFEVAGTDTMEEAYKTDRTFLAGRQRIAGVHVANAERVQIVKPGA